jgi:hypothetical protein
MKPLFDPLCWWISTRESAHDLLGGQEGQLQGSEVVSNGLSLPTTKGFFVH